MQNHISRTPMKQCKGWGESGVMEEQNLEGCWVWMGKVWNRVFWGWGGTVRELPPCLSHSVRHVSLHLHSETHSSHPHVALHPPSPSSCVSVPLLRHLLSLCCSAPPPPSPCGPAPPSPLCPYASTPIQQWPQSVFPY